MGVGRLQKAEKGRDKRKRVGKATAFVAEANCLPNSLPNSLPLEKVL